MVCDILNEEKSNCVAIAVDNAAVNTATLMRELLRKAKKIKISTIIIRDPAHCFDLGAKDLALEEIFIKPVLDTAVELNKFVKIDAIGGIKRKLVGEGKLVNIEASIFPETRMHLAADTLNSAAGQRDFLNQVKSTDEYEVYLKSRKKKVRNKLEATLAKCTMKF